MPKALRAAIGAILLIATIGLATCRSLVVDVQAAANIESPSLTVVLLHFPGPAEDRCGYTV